MIFLICQSLKNADKCQFSYRMGFVFGFFPYRTPFVGFVSQLFSLVSFFFGQASAVVSDLSRKMRSSAHRFFQVGPSALRQAHRCPLARAGSGQHRLEFSSHGGSCIFPVIFVFSAFSIGHSWRAQRGAPTSGSSQPAGPLLLKKRKYLILQSQKMKLYGQLCMFFRGK